jgi:hypothetical protein
MLQFAKRMALRLLQRSLYCQIGSVRSISSKHFWSGILVPVVLSKATKAIVLIYIFHSNQQVQIQGSGSCSVVYLFSLLILNPASALTTTRTNSESSRKGMKSVGTCVQAFNLRFHHVAPHILTGWLHACEMRHSLKFCVQGCTALVWLKKTIRCYLLYILYICSGKHIFLESHLVISWQQRFSLHNLQGDVLAWMGTMTQGENAVNAGSRMHVRQQRLPLQYLQDLQRNKLTQREMVATTCNLFVKTCPNKPYPRDGSLSLSIYIIMYIYVH